jgi:hypothetical protein
MGWLESVSMAALSVPAQICAVPSGQYPTIQSAIDDAGCSEVELTAQVFVESAVVDRSLTLRGDSSGTHTIEGQVQVTGGLAAREAMAIDAGAPSVGSLFNEAVSMRLWS